MSRISACRGDGSLGVETLSTRWQPVKITAVNNAVAVVPFIVSSWYNASAALPPIAAKLVERVAELLLHAFRDHRAQL